MNKKIEIKENISLKGFTSWKVGGEAEYYCSPRTIDELKDAMFFAEAKDLSISLLGGGTNVLVSDKGVKGLVIHTHELASVNILSEDKNILIESMAGTQKSEILKEFMNYRLRPAIFLAGLPGDMAGGVVMNAGVGHDTSPKEFCEIVHSIDVLEMTNKKIIEKTFTKDQIEWSYRKSKNWQPGIITKVRVTWPNEPDDNVLKEVRDGNKRRKSTQPLNMPSCGSVFKNPPGDHSGALIEKAGLKGQILGGAQVSEKHGNFIVNLGDAKAADINDLIKFVQKSINEKFSIQLTNEVVYLGEWGE